MMPKGRQKGILAIGDDLAQSLARYRALFGIDTLAVMTINVVRDVEDKLGTRLADDIWAYLAATGRYAGQVPAFTEDARQWHDVPTGFIAFDRSPELEYFCAKPRKVTGIHIWSKTVSGVKQWRDMVEFVDWRCLQAEDVDSWSARKAPRLEAEGQHDLPCFPELIERVAGFARRVFHPVFGEGTVLREMDGKRPKVEVDFGTAGRKIVVTSFLRDLDSVPGAAA